MATFSPIQKPESIVVGLNVSYTVPVGRVSRVKATLSVTNQGYVSADTLNTSDGSAKPATASSNSQTVEMILPAGTILSSTRTTNAGSTNVSFGAQGERVTDSVCTMTVNASNSCTVRAAGGISTTQIPGGAGLQTITTVASSDFGFIAEEYFE